MIQTKNKPSMTTFMVIQRIEGRNFAENDEDIKSPGSDFDYDDNQMLL